MKSQQKCIVVFALLCCFAVLVALIFSAVDIWGEDEDGITEDNCSRDCRAVVVENIPEDVSFSNSTASHLPLSAGLFGLLDRAVRVVEIVSPLWLLNSSEYESSLQPAARQGGLLLSRLQALKSQKIQLKVSSGIVDSAELKTLAAHGAEVHYVNTTALTKGRLHSSFWVVDRRHFYVGSGSMDWRSLATRKELGVLVYNCSCLALDLHRVFNIYWGLQYKDFIPSFWSKRLFAIFNKDSPLELALNGTKARAYVSVSEEMGGGGGDYWIWRRELTRVSTLPRYWSRIDGLLREALILRRVRVRLLISCWENTHPLTFNFVWSLRSLCMEQADCSLEAKFFNPRVQRDGSLRGINHNRFMVTDRAIYLGNLDWVGNEFTHNAGVGLVIGRPEGVEEEKNSAVVDQLRAAFERDWFSSYARSLQANKIPVCSKRQMDRAGPAKDGQLNGEPPPVGTGRRDSIPAPVRNDPQDGAARGKAKRRDAVRRETGAPMAVGNRRVTRLEHLQARIKRTAPDHPKEASNPWPESAGISDGCL
ncbi:inactive phospholipase D5-like [Hippocampus comes]|uniref:inactive phospholipase D5-like n=1 Tax=Hippocampus comes TaxID=109280 RepID=UPI00094ECADD|nr:PREDICTED: inactive phospholipase D5-like [Hippocampus comes]